GMTNTFLIAICMQVIERPLLAPVPTWFQTADICSVGMIAAVGFLHPSSSARLLGISLIVPLLTLWTLPPFLSHTWDDWWDSLRDTRFEIYWAIAVVSGIWFTLERLRFRFRRSGVACQPAIIAPRACFGIML